MAPRARLRLFVVSPSVTAPAPGLKKIPLAPIVRSLEVVLSLVNSVEPVLLKVMPAMLVFALKVTVSMPLTLDWLKTTESVDNGTTPVVPPVVAVSDQLPPMAKLPVRVVFQ